ncbi:T9SS type A sorting domain-containing protein [uncultured Pontibacter sp.]|uniref:lectin-like domain-containing protein n=1 Tax=uncultured Pontibacter sp. TaxID=453356 RepID=UPI002610B0A2|nr:T9SS type A sorting domain-containing protein [uncultured Pontibacter sp.]
MKHPYLGTRILSKMKNSASPCPAMLQAPKQRSFSGVATVFCAIFLILFTAGGAQAQVCASPGKDGVLTSSVTMVNTYYPGTAFVSAGANKNIALGATRTETGVTFSPIAKGDLVLIIQMQGAEINSSNSDAYGDGVSGGGAQGNLNNTNFTAGQYEYAVALSDVPLSGGTLTVASLVNSYSNANATTSQGQLRYQVVRVPQYSSVTLGANLTSPAWNGTTGGVVAMDVTGRLNFNSRTIDVSGKGFRGGAGRALSGSSASGLSNTDFRTTSNLAANAQKGEGTAGTPAYVNDQGVLVNTGVEGYPNGSMGRGAPGNAGGGGTDGRPSANDQNAGGGGGANGGAGGLGGNSWSSNLAVGGYGGAAFAQAAAIRLIMGGGGGAGTTNNATGTPNNGFASSGAAGGGIVFVRAGSVTGTGTVNASGASANNTVANDGSGGGGAGGSVLITATSGLSSIAVNVAGGNGGTNTGGDSNHGPGGGGGGGVVYANGNLNSANITAGAAGRTFNNTSFGALNGSNGKVIQNVSLATLTNSASGAACLPNLTVTKTTSTPLLARTAGSAITADYAITVTNTGGAAQGITIQDVLPSGFSFDSHLSFAGSGYSFDNGGNATTGAVSASSTHTNAGTTTVTYSSFTINSGGSLTIHFKVNVPSSVADGTYQNPATVTYLDPTRSTATLKIAPGGSYQTTSSAATAGGSNYASSSSTGEDVTVNTRPTTDAKSIANIPNTASYTSIPAFSGADTAPGTVTKYVIKSISGTAAQGTLYKGTTALTVGNEVLASEVSSLRFLPNGGTGNFVFTYAAVDNQGAEDATPDTYTIGLVGDNAAVYSAPNTYAKMAVANGSVVATVTDADGAVTNATVAGAALPSFLTLNATSGAISVNSGAVVSGTYTTSVRIIDAKGGISTVPVTITITDDKFQASGTATRTAENCYQLTTATANQQGQVWSVSTIDLSKSFEITFNINLGNNDNGADGVAFGFQRVATNPVYTSGSGGGGLGFSGITPSVGIEFDTYQNGSDPAEDHLNFFLNGNLGTPVTAQVQMSNANANTEDGKDHAVKVIWVKETNTMAVYFDGVLRSSYTSDIIKQVFGSNPNVYFGFTGSTGGAVNNQSVCQIKYNMAPEATDLTRNNSVSSSANNDSNLNPNVTGTDPDGGSLSFFRLTTLPAVGVLKVNGEEATLGVNYAWSLANALQYNPQGNATSNVTFTYTVIDADGAEDSTPATYTIPVNMAPKAVAVTNPVLLNTAAATLLTPLEATDADGTIQDFQIRRLPTASEGVLYVNGEPVTSTGTRYPWSSRGLLSFDPAPGNLNDVRLNFRVRDNEGLTSTTAAITIPINGEPVAIDQTNTVALANGAAATKLDALNGLDSDGTVSSFRFAALPSAAQGVLYVDNEPADLTTAYPWAAASKVYFDPAVANLANVTFRYIIRDNENAEDSSPAVFTIRIAQDWDADGVTDAEDLDDDNDGIPDTLEGNGDKDGDGIINSLDLDSDGDGILDAVEANKGVVPAAAIFSLETGRYTSAVGANGLVDVLETTPGSGNINYTLPDTDGDKLHDFLDIDADNDGILDNVEAQLLNSRVVKSGADADGDGIDNAFDLTCGCSTNGVALVPVNTDGDALPDYLDLDSDNDETPDEHEAHDTNDNGDSADDLKLLAEQFWARALGNSKNYYAANGQKYEWLADGDNNRVTDYLQFGSMHYYDSDNDGLVDLFDADSYGQETAANPSFRDAGTITPLPVTLISFTAQAQNGGVLLKWATATELSNDYFIVERSINGRTFEEVSRVKGAGSSSVRLDYSLLDSKAPAGVVYYRLKQVDFDGQFEYSRVAMVRVQETAAPVVKLYPNPAVSTVNLDMTTLPDAVYRVRIVSMDGRVLRELNIEGRKIEQLDINQLPSGNYLLQVQGAQFAKSLKLIKQ